MRVLVVVLAFLLAACGGSSGGGDGGNGGGDTGNASSSSGSSNTDDGGSSEDDGDSGTGKDGSDEGDATPTPTSALVEKAGCRARLGEVEQVLTAMQDGGLKRAEYLGQVAQLKALEKKAKASCSAQVDRPLVKALSTFDRAGSSWSTCGKKCPMDDIAEDVYAAQDLAYEAVEAANRTK